MQLPPWPLRARLSAWSIAARTAMMSLPSTWMQSRPPAMPFCASVLAPVCALRGTEIAHWLLMMHWMNGSVYAPAELIAAYVSVFDEPPSPQQVTATRFSPRSLNASAAPAACRHWVAIGTHHG